MTPRSKLQILCDNLQREPPKRKRAKVPSTILACIMYRQNQRYQWGLSMHATRTDTRFTYYRG